MESITKNRQPIGTLRAMAARAYGPDVVPPGDDWVSELEHGWFNVTYQMRLRDGRQVVLKIAPPPAVEVMTYERGAMAVELAALRLITERTDVPVPTVDFADQSQELCDAAYFFMPFIDADNLSLIRSELAAEDLDAYHEVLVEWDLWDGNVMIRSGAIVSILDHERAFFGDPLIEVGFAGTQSAGARRPSRIHARLRTQRTDGDRPGAPPPVLPAPGPDHDHRDRLPRIHRPPAV